MTTYTITIKDKPHQVSRKQFIAAVFPVAGMAVLSLAWSLWVCYLSSEMINDYTGIPKFIGMILVVALLCTFEFNGQKRSLVRPKIQAFLGLVIFCSVLYYEYTVHDWGVLGLGALVLPLATLHLYKWARVRMTISKPIEQIDM